MIKIGSESDRRRVFEAEQKRQQDIEREKRQRFYRSLLQKHEQQAKAERTRQEHEEQWKVDNLRTTRDRLRDQLAGLQECHQAEAKHHQDWVNRLNEAELDADLDQQALEQLQSDYQQERGELQEHIDSIESELTDINGSND